MSIKTKREIVADVIRTAKIMLFTTMLIILTSWLALGTYAMSQVSDLKEKVEYYEEKLEEEKDGEWVVYIDEESGKIIRTEHR